MSETFDIPALVDNVTEMMVAQDLLYPNFKYRTGQREIIIRILEEFINKGRQTVVLDSPTGTGKSVISRVVAEVINFAYETDSMWLTATIALQNQYLNDFPAIKTLYSAKNYACHTDVELPIPSSKKWHKTCRYRKTDGGCLYNKARNLFKEAKTRCLNYAFFMTAAGNPEYMVEGLLVADEAHNLAGKLIDFSEITINIDAIDRIIKDVDMSTYVSQLAWMRKEKTFDIESTFGIIRYLEMCSGKLSASIQKIKNAAESIQDEASLAKFLTEKLEPLEDSLNYANQLASQLRVYARGNVDEWAITNDTGERDLIFSLKPVFVPENAINIIMAPKFRLLMTATPFTLANDLKIPQGTFSIISTPYTWALENRPVITNTELPSMNYETRDSVFGRYVNELDKFIANFPDQIGIIHTASYKNAEDILKSSDHASRMYIPKPKEIRNLEEILVPGRIFVSPSMMEGIDMPDDKCRFQVIFKLSYPFLGDPWVQKKKDYDPLWYPVKTMTDVIQSSGRGVRHENDWCVMYILDQSFGRLLNQIEMIVPEWFVKSIE